MKQEKPKVEAVLGQFPTEGCPLAQFKPIFLQESKLILYKKTHLTARSRKATQVNTEGSKYTQTEEESSATAASGPGKACSKQPQVSECPCSLKTRTSSKGHHQE